MRSNANPKSYQRITAIVFTLLLATGLVNAAPTTVNLTAQRMSTTLPDGNIVPMWGLCTTDTAGAASLGGATLTGGACTTTGSWAAGPTITIPYDALNGSSLTINLTNTLPTPTSIVILGQIGGGLGTPNKEASPAHSTQTITFPAQGAAGDPVFTPPAQGPRARSFSAEASANSGTQTYTWATLKPGTYIYETGTHPSIQAPMGLYGVLVVTTAPVGGPPSTTGTAYTGISYDADATLLFSEIDPKLNASVDTVAVNSAGCTAMVGACTGIINESQYPPAVNYSPLYFLINGRAFDSTAPQNNAFAINAPALSKNVLVRFANAGLRTHIPSIVGLSLSLVAEDGNLAPGNPKVQSEVLLTAGKTFDAIVNPAFAVESYTPASFAIFDRQLSLSTNKTPGGMQAILQVAGGLLPNALQCAANSDNYTVAVNSASFSGNVLSNDRGIIGATLGNAATGGTVVLNRNGTFTYTPTAAPVSADSFTYTGLCAATQTPVTATVSLNVSGVGQAPTAGADSYTSKVTSLLKVQRPGVLANDTDPSGHKLSAVLDTAPAGLTVILNPDGSFTAQPAVVPVVATTYTFNYHAVNAQGTASSPTSVTLTFNTATGLQVSLLDSQTKVAIANGDYSWTIEEDATWYQDPANPAGTGTTPTSLATSFHKSYMPLVATGCTGPRSCGDANTINGTQPVVQQIRTMPADVVLDASKRYFISILPSDAIDGDSDANTVGHSIGGAPIAPGQTAVTVLAPSTPMPPAQISVIVFEDSGPTNGTVDAGESGLEGFTINLFDTRGSTGDVAGQMTYDVYAMPLTNALAGTLATDGSGINLCPLTTPMGVITTCPRLDSAGRVSPLAGMALIKNLNPGRYDVTARPGVEVLGRGENWIQVSTLEGTRNNDTFIKPGEPAFWQEFGSPGFHSYIGFVNPAHVQAAKAALNASNTITGKVSSLHMDRPPAAALNDSCVTGTATDPTCRASLSYTNCQVSVNLGGTGANISYADCDNYGNFTLTGIPSGTHEIVIWDQHITQIISYKAVTVPPGNNQIIAMGTIPVFSWFTRIEQTAYNDLNRNGLKDDGEPGIQQMPMTVRFRDGSISNYLSTDITGDGGTNELFPLFNWYVVEADTARYKGTGVTVTYDAGGKPDTAGQYAGVLNSTETDALPLALRVPGATYTAGTTTRVDPGTTFSEGLQGYINQTAAIDWGKTPYDLGENGGITGLVYYGSTRGIDDPRLTVQFAWEPAIPRIPVNLYSKTTNADGTIALTLIDSTTTSSWDDNADSIHCPGTSLSDPFITYTLGAANQFKCYDGQHTFNQVQPAVYDGRYRFPSAAYLTAHPTGLPTGKYVVEVALPEGYLIVREEDKNIFGGDSWVSPSIATQFAGFGNVFILPDQATINNSVVSGSGAAFPACVGEAHRVPDFLSLFPEQANVSPFAGQDRALCDRKEVALADQGQVTADFSVFTQTPIAAHFTGMMLNDTAAEFNPISPTFGEKAALPNAPVSFRDYNGVEILRVYNDKWGTFNGLTPSTWSANIPNPSGYAPNMLTSCMNDPGPIPDPAGTIDPATGTVRMITDPLYNPMLSNFCYNWPYMPGQTTYLDTPVLPVSGFASATSYTPVDCQYPNATPAISRVDGDSVGPWISAAGARTIRITALGDVSVPNPAYEGPTALPNPLAPTVNQPKITRHYGFGATPGTLSVNGVALTNVTWTDTAITATVPAAATTGELVITAANGNQSVDTVTVTVGGTAPTIVRPAGGVALSHVIQDAIDAAAPGALIMLEAGSYPELVIMNKPVRLQGVGAASVVINAAKYPGQKLVDWRNRINALFGIDVNGSPVGTATVDLLPGQPIGAVTLLEPTILSSDEGAGITVLAKGLRANGTTQLNGLANGDCNPASVNYFAGNFKCAAARIDGITVTGGDAGGGIFVNGWAHGLEIANNRVYGNAGSFNGGVRIGHPYLGNTALPPVGQGFGYDVGVNIHHNAITTNGMVAGAPGVAGGANAGGAGGGLSVCAGSDNYRVTGNWVCGNFSSANGGGIGHIGMSMNGNISKNVILFNESYASAGSQNGGGLIVEGEVIAGAALTLGTGNLTVDSNLIQGNFARGGHGGGVRLQNVNGADLSRVLANRWRVSVINNIIVNNVAGWSGGGISMADTLYSTISNNTVASNDSTGIVAGVFNTMVNGVSTGPATGAPSPAGISSELTSAPLLAALPVGQRPANTISTPVMDNNIVWQNRSFFFDLRDVNGVSKAMVIASNDVNDALTHVGSELPAQATTGQCMPGAKYWDLGVVGNTTTVPGGANLRLNPRYSVLTANIAGYTGVGNRFTDPKLVTQYCNGARALPGVQFEPGVAFLPPFQLAAAAALNEGGNFVDLTFGPLSLNNPGTPAIVNGNYHLLDTTSSAYNTALNLGATDHDFDGQSRPQDVVTDIGADELVTVSLSPSVVDFGALQNGIVSAPRTVTVTNLGATALLLNALNAVTLGGANAANFSLIAVGTTCTNGLSIAPGASCVINVSFRPVNAGARIASLNVNDARGTQSATLTGIAVAPAASVAPASLTFAAQAVLTTSPAQTVTVTNTGIGPLAITTVALAGLNPLNFAIVPAGTTCTNGSSVAVGASCVINVTFRPLAGVAVNRTAILRITDGAGIQNVPLTGTRL